MEQSLITHIKEIYLSEFQKEPLVVFSPGRINFIGEHTDYNNGFVFPAAIDKGIYLAIEKSGGNLSDIRALDLNESFVFNMKQPEGRTYNSWQDYFLGIVAELKIKGLELGEINVVFSGTIDAGAGMSSSAALENAFIYGLNELFGLGLTKTQMIHISQAAEHNYVGVKCGIMDQYTSMYGRSKSALFLDCKTLKSETYNMNLDGVSILLINTNVKHKLSDSAYNQRRASCERVAAYFMVDSLRELEFNNLIESKDQLSLEDYEKAHYVLEENKRVLAFKEAVIAKDIKMLGKLLYASHEGLKNKYEVSCEELDFLVDYGKDKSYVLGSRMMGGGFGGCTINLIESDHVTEFGQQISKAYFQQFNRSCDLINVRLSDGTKQL